MELDMMYQNVDSIFIVLNNKTPHPSIIKKNKEEQ
jgi:hypothetical protein